MEALKPIFPDFVSNQILTNTQLNELRIFLDRQDRRTRVRLVGTGIVCGWTWDWDAETSSLVVDDGLGVTVGGYLIELERTVYTHWRPYLDPGADDEQEFRPLWGEGVYELLSEETMAGASPPEDESPPAIEPLPEQPDQALILVLYLEMEPRELKSCLVTDCNNRGRNVHLNVRALAVPVDPELALERAAACPPTPEVVRIPRLAKRVLETVSSGVEIDAAYGAIIAERLPGLVRLLAEDLLRYSILLDLGGAAIDPFEGFESAMNAAIEEGRVGQYHYDLLCDLARARDEFATAACGLIGDCCPDLGRTEAAAGRYLMLGHLLGGKGYRHLFVPSPVRHLAGDDLNRVRKLFQRMVAMVESFYFDPSGEARVTPSHGEIRQLGAGAVPFYFEMPGLLADVWQPRLCCTTARLWFHSNQGEPPVDVDFDYNECSLLRIEGHLGMYCGGALETLEWLRHQHNLEFQVVISYLQDSDLTEDDLLGELLESRERRRDLQRELREALAADDVSEAVPIIKRLGETRESPAYLEWRQARRRRNLFYASGDLETDYLAARRSVARSASWILGELETVSSALNQVAGSPGYPGQEVEKTAYERLAAAAAAGWVYSEQRLVYLLEQSPLWLAWRGAIDALRAALEALVRDDLPRDLVVFSQPRFHDRIREIVRDAIALDLLRWLTPQLPREAAEIVESLPRLARGCEPPRLAGVYFAYRHLRRDDPSLFTNLVGRADGLEHLAGVEKGGTFVLVCDQGDDGRRVVADFSLAGQMPCCRELEPRICTPPVAQPDSRIVLLERGGAGDGTYETVELAIDVLANDFNPSTSGSVPGSPGLTVRVPETRTELGGEVRVSDEDPTVVVYRYGNPVPGSIDRFAYILELDDGRCQGQDVGEVLILMTRPETGSIWARVVERQEDGSQRPVADAEVVLAGQQSGFDWADDGGRARFKDLPPGDYVLRASFEGRVTRRHSVSLEPGELETLALRLPPATGSLRGFVFADSVCDPVASARVALGGNTTTTDTNGRFGFEQLELGHYTVKASHDGRNDSTGATVVAGREAEVMLCLPHPTGSIEVLVEEAAGEPFPIVNAEVVLSGRQSRVRWTSDAGTVEFDDLPAGAYFVYASKDGRISPQISRSVAPGESTSVSLALPAATGLVRGFVFRQGVCDPVDGAKVTLEGEVVKAIWTDANGHFECAGLPHGSYVVRASKDGAGSEPVSVVVESGQQAGVMLCLPVATGRINGEVLDEWIHTPHVATVELSGPGGERETQSDVKGRFEIDRLAPGNYTLRARDGEQQSEPVIVELPAGGDRGVTLLLPVPTETIYGLVTEFGEPVANELVLLDDRLETPTDSQGRYAFYHQEAGEHVAQVREIQEGGVLWLGQTLRLDFKLVSESRFGTITGTVQDTSGAALPGIEVGIYALDRLTTTGSDGRFRIRQVPWGTYTLEVRNGKLVVASQKVNLDRASIDIVITLGPIPPSFEYRLSDHLELSRDVQQRFISVFSARHAERLSDLSSVGRDAAVKSSRSYAAAESFLGTAATGSSLDQKSLDSAFRETFLGLVKAIGVAAAKRKDAYRQLLATVSLAYLDRLTLLISAAPDPRVVTSIRAMMERFGAVGIDLEQFRRDWNSDALSADLEIKAAGVVAELLG